MSPRYLAVAGGFLTQFTVIGVMFGFGLYVKVFEAEFGWSRTLVSVASALAFTMMGVLAVPAGRLSDRFGPRRVLLVTAVMFSVGLALLSRISAPWQLFAVMATLVAMGLGSHDVVTLSTVVRWFDKSRGMMTAVVKVGTALGQVALPLIVAALIAWVGWRATFVVLGGGALVILVSAALMMSHPGPGEGPELTRGKAARGLDFSEARRTATLWKLFAIQFLFFLSLMTLPVHLAPHGMDLGLSTAQAASLLSVVGGASIAGRLIVGGLIDRIGGRNALSFCLLVLVLANTGFALVDQPGVLFAVTAVYGFAHGALFVVVSPTVAYYFGMKAHGAIFGAVLFAGTLGSAIGPVSAGAAFDQIGSYGPAFVTLAVLAAMALVLARRLPLLPEEQAR